MDIHQLKEKFSVNEKNTQLSFTFLKGDIPIIEIKNKYAAAKICMQGAHLLSYIAVNKSELIWLSEDAQITQSKSIRGGIPVCWPWFGAHESEKSFPAHGFARTQLWSLVSADILATGETKIIFELDLKVLPIEIQKYWPYKTRLQYSVLIGKALELKLETFNDDEKVVTIGQALHSYFYVNDIKTTKVVGLAGKEYLDKPDGFKRKIQKGDIEFNAEVDRIYLQTPDDIIIDDGLREIKIKKQGSESTVVWNPWKQLADKMADLGADGYLKMLCVESANAADDVVDILPGESHVLEVSYNI